MSTEKGENGEKGENETKYKPLDVKPKVALVMMVKNEHKRITISLDSAINYVDLVIILDTGSEDETIKIIKEYCEAHNKPFHLIEQKVVPFHFANARNIVLDFADDKCDYMLLLDCNDELKSGENMRKFVDSYDGASTAFHICQEWWNGSSLDKYYNVRLVKTKNEWKYKGAIHEYISCPEAEKKPEERKNKDTPVVSRLTGFTIYQDRTKDDDKSFKRFFRDEEVFDAEYQEILQKKIKDPTVKQDPRTVFYYGQTCMCINKNEKAYKLYKERTSMVGFIEETYHAYYRCGELSKRLGHDWEESMTWYIKAYEYSTKVFNSPRAEPLYRIAEYYRDKCWDLCYMYLRRCCELVYPESAILFVDKRLYDYSRWHLMGIVAFYAKQIDVGKIACLRAISQEPNSELDIKNLHHYITDKEEAEKLINIAKKGNVNFQIEAPRPSVQQILEKEEPKTHKELLQNKLSRMRDMRKKKNKK